MRSAGILINKRGRWHRGRVGGRGITKSSDHRVKRRPRVHNLREMKW